MISLSAVITPQKVKISISIVKASPISLLNLYINAVCTAKYFGSIYLLSNLDFKGNFKFFFLFRSVSRHNIEYEERGKRRRLSEESWSVQILAG